jgi:hypothetical protein
MATKGRATQVDSALKREVKEAVREVVDETLVNYTNGAAAFADSMTATIGRMVDSFDEFFTKNLMADRPDIANAFLDARLRASQENVKALNAKLTNLRRLRTQSAVEARSNRGARRPRKRRSTPSSTSS